MLSKLLIALCLMTLCVAIHAGGVTLALRRVRRYQYSGQQFWRVTWFFSCISGWMILLHLCEIFVWSVVYCLMGAIPDLTSAAYFSAVTYTTTGYGDVVLPQDWRLVGGVQALTGILMCGWSTGFFVATVARWYDAR
jgi:hypothetical protein